MAKRIRTPDPEGDILDAARLAFDTMYDDARKGGASEDTAHKLAADAWCDTIRHLDAARGK